MELNSTPLNSTQLNSTQLNSTQLNSTQLNSTQLYSTMQYSTPLYSTLLYSTILYFTLLPTLLSAGSVNLRTAREGVSSKTPNIKYRGFKAGSAFNITGSSSVAVGEEVEEEAGAKKEIGFEAGA